jgi:hypothetical protein
VYTQIAQQTRLRSIFIKNSEEKMKALIPKAQKQSAADWEGPSWWNKESDDDYDLLTNILDFGYSGFDEMMASDAPFCVKLKQETEESSNFCRPMAQQRINNLTRDLHSIDENEE